MPSMAKALCGLLILAWASLFLGLRVWLSRQAPLAVFRARCVLVNVQLHREGACNCEPCPSVLSGAVLLQGNGHFVSLCLGSMHLLGLDPPSPPCTRSSQQVLKNFASTIASALRAPGVGSDEPFSDSATEQGLLGSRREGQGTPPNQILATATISAISSTTQEGATPLPLPDRQAVASERHCPLSWGLHVQHYGLREVSRQEARAALQGKTIVFMGDSAIRKLYQAMMDILSGPGVLHAAASCHTVSGHVRQLRCEDAP